MPVNLDFPVDLINLIHKISRLTALTEARLSHLPRRAERALGATQIQDLASSQAFVRDPILLTLKRRRCAPEYLIELFLFRLRDRLARTEFASALDLNR